MNGRLALVAGYIVAARTFDMRKVDAVIGQSAKGRPATAVSVLPARTFGVHRRAPKQFPMSPS